MTTVCMECHKVLSVSNEPPYEISHGIGPCCWDAYRAKHGLLPKPYPTKAATTAPDGRFRVIDVSALTTHERDTLAADVGAVVEETYPLDATEGAPNEAFPEAERTLLSRIGGQVNLRHYVVSIMRRAATE